MGGYLKTTLFLIALSLAACAGKPAHEETLNEQGYKAMQAGNMEEAERLLTEAVDQNPGDLEAALNLATLYQKTNRPEQARPLYQYVIDAEDSAAETGQDADEVARLAQIARDSIAQMDRDAAMQKEIDAAAQTPPPQPVPAPVQEQAANIEAVHEQAMAPLQPEAGYRIQVGAYAVRDNAEKMQVKLMNRHANLIKGRDIHLVQVDRLTKVQIGTYSSVDAAEGACRNLKRVGIDCFRIMK